MEFFNEELEVQRITWIKEEIFGDPHWPTESGKLGARLSILNFLAAAMPLLMFMSSCYLQICHVYVVSNSNRQTQVPSKSIILSRKAVTSLADSAMNCCSTSFSNSVTKCGTSKIFRLEIHSCWTVEGGPCPLQRAFQVCFDSRKTWRCSKRDYDMVSNKLFR